MIYSHATLILVREANDVRFPTKTVLSERGDRETSAGMRMLCAAEAGVATLRTLALVLTRRPVHGELLACSQRADIETWRTAHIAIEDYFHLCGEHSIDWQLCCEYILVMFLTCEF